MFYKILYNVAGTTGNVLIGGVSLVFNRVRLHVVYASSIQAVGLFVYTVHQCMHTIILNKSPHTIIVHKIPFQQDVVSGYESAMYFYVQLAVLVGGNAFNSAGMNIMNIINT